MISDNQRPPNIIRDPSPCMDCAERFYACSDRCPKDARGDFGYKAWKAKVQAVKDARKAYIDNSKMTRSDYEKEKNYGKRH